MSSIICIGAILWDIFDADQHIGGAPFNVAAHIRQAGGEVYFISGVGDDPLGDAALARVTELGLTPRYIRRVAGMPTGTVNVFLSAGQPDFTINRPAAYDYPQVNDVEVAELAATHPACIYFGTLEQTSGEVRNVTRRLISAFPEAKRFYDINLRKDSYSPELITELLAEATVVKLNDDEMQLLGRLLGIATDAGIADFAARLAEGCGLETVCVTRGADGCALWRAGEYVKVPGVPVRLVDAVGAGDAFCSVLLTGLLQPHLALFEIGQAANRLGAFVAGHAGAVPAWKPEDVAVFGGDDDFGG